MAAFEFVVDPLNEQFHERLLAIGERLRPGRFVPETARSVWLAATDEATGVPRDAALTPHDRASPLGGASGIDRSHRSRVRWHRFPQRRHGPGFE
ncbi:hypothetical protein C8039_07950 [Halogeometricum sp. wsp3]|nr:hypothetical protein C8039_07950 [Halogeometricum sp. wsp3]